MREREGEREYKAHTHTHTDRNKGSELQWKISIQQLKLLYQKMKDDDEIGQISNFQIPILNFIFDRYEETSNGC